MKKEDYVLVINPGSTSTKVAILRIIGTCFKRIFPTRWKN